MASGRQCERIENLLFFDTRPSGNQLKAPTALTGAGPSRSISCCSRSMCPAGLIARRQFLPPPRKHPSSAPSGCFIASSCRRRYPGRTAGQLRPRHCCGNANCVGPTGALAGTKHPALNKITGPRSVDSGVDDVLFCRKRGWARPVKRQCLRGVVHLRTVLWKLPTGSSGSGAEHYEYAFQRRQARQMIAIGRFRFWMI